ncbi:MAG: hypothetical protein AAGI30_02780 [Planctomycetota bacterium]
MTIQPHNTNRTGDPHEPLPPELAGVGARVDEFGAALRAEPADGFESRLATATRPRGRRGQRFVGWRVAAGVALAGGLIGGTWLLGPNTGPSIEQELATIAKELDVETSLEPVPLDELLALAEEPGAGPGDAWVGVAATALAELDGLDLTLDSLRDFGDLSAEDRL